MSLTPSGQIVLQFMMEAETRLTQLRSDLDDLSALRRGTVRLAVVEAIASDFLAEVLVDFRGLAPGIEFHVNVCGTHEIADQVAGEHADIGMAFNVLGRDDLVLQGRIRQPLQLICQPGHPLAARSAVSLADLHPYPVALPVHSFGIRYLIDQAAAQAGVVLSIAYEADSLQMLKAIVRRSDIVSFMPPLTFAHEARLGMLKGVDLTDNASKHASIDIITSRAHSLSSAARVFLGALVKYAH